MFYNAFWPLSKEYMSKLKMVRRESNSSNSLQSGGNSGLDDYLEERLDYEADDIDDCETELLSSVTTEDINVSHQRDMVSPFSEDISCDNRKNEYISIGCLSSDTSKTFLDSSSEEASVSSHEDGRLLSPLNMTPEEEERFLQSDDEDEVESMEESTSVNGYDTSPTNEDEQSAYYQEEEEEPLSQYNSQNFFSNKVVRSDSNNITITAFTNGNTRKRSPPKWELKYSPKIKSTRLFLNEIGYLTDSSSCDGSVSSKTSDNELQPQRDVESVTSVRITCGDNVRVIQQIEKSVTNKMQNDPGFKFKVPTLPPAKRPPTRPKKHEKIVFDDGRQLASTDNNWQTRKITNDKCRIDKVHYSTAEDDVVSIGASMSGLEDISDAHLDDEIENRSENYLDSEKQSDVEQWVSSTNNSANTDVNIPSLLDCNIPPPIPPNGVNETLQPPLGLCGPRIDFRSIPLGFTGICYHHFFSPKGCTRTKCGRIHYFPKEKFASRCKDMEKPEIINMYKLMLHSPKSYQASYDAFLKLFAIKKMEEELVESIRDFYTLLNENERTRAVEMVVRFLTELGLTILEAVERILFTVGIIHYPPLADSLMEILAKTVDLKNHWPMIKKIVLSRKSMSPMLANQILTNITTPYPIDKHLCIEVYNVLITERRTDVNQIHDQLLLSCKLMANKDNSTNQTARPSSSTPQSRKFSPIPPPVVENVPIGDATFIIDRRSNHSSERDESDEEKDEGLRNSFSRNVNFETGTVTALYDDSTRNTHLADRVSPACSHSSNPVNLGCSTSQGIPSMADNQYVPQNLTPNLTNTYSISSPYHCNPEINLCPERPIIGKTKYSDDFQLDRSLHHLLPKIIRHTVPISENDSIVLNQAIKKCDGALFLNLLEKNKNEAVIENFICMIVVQLKQTRKGVIILLQLLKSVESDEMINKECWSSEVEISSNERRTTSINPDFKNDLYIKVVFEVVTMNLMVEREGRSLFGLSKDVILCFKDWDSVVSSKLLQVLGSRKFSHMRRYILLGKMLAHDNYFFHTYEILVCKELHLLESIDLWPYTKHEDDMVYRDLVLNLCFNSAFRTVAAHVADLYKRLFLGQIAEYNVTRGAEYLNANLKCMIEERTSLILGCFISNIELYYTHLNRDILRAFTILRFSQADLHTKIKLYELCCHKKIYECFYGDEPTITVRTDFFNEEHRLIITNYFYKLSLLKYHEYTDLKIEITVPKNNVSKMTFFNYLRSLKDTCFAVRNILKKDFDIDTECDDKYSSIILIPKDAVLSYLRRSNT